MRGRPQLRWCPSGHDKWEPGGIHFYVQMINGKEFKRRLCAKCMEERNARRRSGVRDQTRMVKELCKFNHNLNDPENVFYIERKYVKISGETVWYKIRSCIHCRRDRDTALNKKNRTPAEWGKMIDQARRKMDLDFAKRKQIFLTTPIESPRFISKLERFLAMPAPRLHTSDPFERRNAV